MRKKKKKLFGFLRKGKRSIETNNKESVIREEIGQEEKIEEVSKKKIDKKELKKKKKIKKEKIKKVIVEYNKENEIKHDEKKESIFSKLKRLKKRRLALLIIVSIIVILLLIFTALYMGNEDFRRYADLNIFNKLATEENLKKIDIQSVGYANSYENNYNTFLYEDKICTLNNNTLNIYNNEGNKEKSLKIEISTPEVKTCENRFIIAEKYGNKVYMIFAGEIIWEKELNGYISKININKNGYTSIVLSGTTYKSVIYLFDSTGEEVFRSYISNSVVVDTDISEDNKYLAYAEVNTTGTLIESNVKVISIEEAKKNPERAITYTYEGESDKLITQIKYQGSNIVCLYDDKIIIIKNNQEEKVLVNTKEDNIIFADINLLNDVVVVKELNKDDKALTRVEIINSSSGSINAYNIEGASKSLNVYKDKIIVNLGAEIYIINTRGWLVKKFVTEQDIGLIEASNKILAIIDRNQIKILDI